MKNPRPHQLGLVELLGYFALLAVTLAVLATTTAGCGLLLEAPVLRGSVFSCGVVVRSADGFERTISSADPLLQGRSFYTCSESSEPGCEPACNDVGVGERFARLVSQRISEVAAEPLGDDPSDFRLHPGPWCVVAESPCVAVRAWASETPAPCAASTSERLPLCPTPGGPPEMCLETNPTSIDFADTLAGNSSTPTILNVNNCGTTSCPVRVSDALLGDSEHFTVTANECAPTPEDLRLMRDRILVPTATDPAGATCGVSIAFSPRARGRHRATLVVASDCAAEQRIELGGNSQGGTASVTPADLCTPAPAAGACAAEQTVTINNAGPGSLRITRNPFFSRGAPNFRVVASPPVPFDIPAGGSQNITVQFCDIDPAAGRDGTLDITTDDPMNPTLVVRVAVSGSCP